MSVLSHTEAQRRLVELLQKQKEQEEERDDLLQKAQEWETKITETKLEYARTHNAAFSPILDFPVEVTALIFKQLYGYDERNEVALSHVCHSWRSVALTSPEIWSRFLYRNTLHAEKRELVRLSVYLQRSGKHLLDLRFVIPMLLENMTPTVVALLEKAKEHAARWRCFSLELVRKILHDSWVHEKALDLVSGLVHISSENLKLFEVILPSGSRSQVENSQPRWIPAHQSSTVDWEDICLGRMDVRSFSRCLPPFCITTFQLESTARGQYLVSISWLIDILCMTEYSLVNLTVGPGCISPLDPPSGRQIVKSLKNLYCEDEALANWLWNSLYAPQLELLIFSEILFDGSSNDIVPSDPFPTPSFPSLRSLTLIDCNFGSSDTMNALANATKPASHIYMFHGGTIWKLTQDTQAAQAIPWPNMTTLTCSLADKILHSSYELYWDFVDRQSKLVSHFTLEIPQEDAEQWKSEDPQTWESLQASGRFKVLPTFVEVGSGTDILRYIPWPVPQPSIFW